MPQHLPDPDAEMLVRRLDRLGRLGGSLRVALGQLLGVGLVALGQLLGVRLLELAQLGLGPLGRVGVHRWAALGPGQLLLELGGVLPQPAQRGLEVGDGPVHLGGLVAAQHRPERRSFTHEFLVISAAGSGCSVWSCASCSCSRCSI